MKVWQGLQVRQLVQFPRTFSKAFSRTIPTPQNSTLTPSSPKTTLSIQNRTRSLVEALRTAKSEQSRQIRLEEFNDHLLRYQSVGKSQAIQEQAISILLEIRKKGNKEVGREAQKALTLLGWADPVKGRGIKVLSIDGGGSR